MLKERMDVRVQVNHYQPIFPRLLNPNLVGLQRITYANHRAQIQTLIVICLSRQYKSGYIRHPPIFPPNHNITPQHRPNHSTATRTPSQSYIYIFTLPLFHFYQFSNTYAIPFQIPKLHTPPPHQNTLTIKFSTATTSPIKHRLVSSIGRA